MRERIFVGMLAIGCGGAESGKADGESGTNCDTSALGGLAGAAEVDGQDWSSAGGQWVTTGTGAQVFLDTSGPWGMTFVLMLTDSGDAVHEALADGDVPFVVSFSDDGNSASVRESIGGALNAYATNQPGGEGEVRVSAFDGTSMTTCFDFVAVDGDAVMMDVAGVAMVDGS